MDRGIQKTILEKRKEEKMGETSTLYEGVLLSRIIEKDRNLSPFISFETKLYIWRDGE